MRRILCLTILALGMVAATAGESTADGRYNGYGRGGPGVNRYYGYGYGPYGNRGYGYGNGGYIDNGYGYGRPGFGISIF